MAITTSNDFLSGMELSRTFFRDGARPVLERNFPGLRYAAALIGYGSDVLGYDDAVSTDHNWGPRFNLYLREEDLGLKNAIADAFAAELPREILGRPTNFTDPAVTDGAQHMRATTAERIRTLIVIDTPERYVRDYLGPAADGPATAADWLAFSEHRLLALTGGEIFHDDLGLADVLARWRYYPAEVRLYLIASQWSIIAQEQAFVKRCGQVGDDLGSRLVASRIVDRLMRLSFLYVGRYAPYSKWFGTAFARLPLETSLTEALFAVMDAADVAARENRLIQALQAVIRLHNASGLADPVSEEERSYFGRDIRVVGTDQAAEAAARRLKGTPLENVQLIGAMSQTANLVDLYDSPRWHDRRRALLAPRNSSPTS